MTRSLSSLMLGAPVTQSQPPVAGWYADPLGKGRRYWDGQGWTEQVREVGPTIVDPASLPPPSAPAAAVTSAAAGGVGAAAAARHRRGEAVAAPRRGVLRHPVTWLIVALVALTAWLGWVSSQGEDRPPLVVTPAGSATP